MTKERHDELMCKVLEGLVPATLILNSYASAIVELVEGLDTHSEDEAKTVYNSVMIATVGYIEDFLTMGSQDNGFFELKRELAKYREDHKDGKWKD